MINELIKLADELDSQGLKRQANILDRIIKKAAWGDGYEPSYFGMSKEDFKDLVVSIYETDFDETKEGWDPREDDMEDIYSHLAVVPHPSDYEYRPETDEQYWERNADGEYTFKKEIDEESMDKDALLNYEIAMKIKDIMPNWGVKSESEISDDERQSWIENVEKEDDDYNEELLRRDPRHPDNFPVDDWWNAN
jgi:hypothetical protein